MNTAPRFTIAILFASCMLLCSSRLTWAADKGGQLDAFFKVRGRIILTDIGDGTFEAAYALAVQPDGKIVAVGFSSPAVGPSVDFALVRYESTGRIDRRFGDNGRVLTDFSGTGSTDQAFAVAIDSIGRIVVAGYSSSNVGVDFAVARYNPDGTPDNSFNSTGKVLTNLGANDAAMAVAIDSNDRIVVAGSSNAGGTYDFAVVRYNVDGTLDTRVLTDVGLRSGDFATAVVIQADGKIVVGGLSDASGIPYDFALVRYNSNGTLDLDRTFNKTGKGRVLTDFTGSGSYDALQALAVQSDGMIVAAGESISSGGLRFAMARYNPDGTPDNSFNSTGKVVTAFDSGNASAQAVVIQSDGKIVAAGSFDDGNPEGPDFALARYNTDGTLDSTFNSTGELVTDIGGFDVAYGVGIQPDGTIVAAGFSDVKGTSDFALTRYLP